MVSSVTSQDQEFEIVFDMHPHINIFSQGRYITVEKEEVFAKNPTPFGRSSLIAIVDGGPKGQYALRAVTGKFWAVDAQGIVKGKSKTIFFLIFPRLINISFDS